MRRVTNWQDYKDNWQEWTDSLIETGIDAGLSALLIGFHLLVFIPVTLMVLVGIAPDIKEGDDE